VPGLIVEHDALLILDVDMVIDVVEGFIRNFFIQLTTILIVFIDIFALLPRCCHIVGQHQVHSLLAVHHPARGVDARPYFKDDIVDGNLLAVESADLDDTPQAEARVGVELL